jgi:hypothetical protein
MREFRFKPRPAGIDASLVREGCSEPVDERRFSWGGVYPVGWPEGPSRRRAECLVEGDDPALGVRVGFLQLVEHGLLDAGGEPVEELTVNGVRHTSWLETIEREVRIAEVPGRTASIAIGADETDDLLEGGVAVGRLVRRRETLHGTIEAWLERVEPGLRRLNVSVANRLVWDGRPFERTLMHTLCSTDVAVQSFDGALLGQAERAGASLR